MITTNERQENLLDQHASLMNPSQAREMRQAGLGIIESRREGAYVWDQSGTRYIDCRPETSVFNVGRRNPDLIKILKSALDEYDIGNSMFFSESRVHLAQKLGALSPGGALRAVTYGVSGGEINDFVLKLARAQTGRKRVVGMADGYHGSTGFSASVSGESRFRSSFEPLVPDISFAEFGSLESLRAQMSDDVACVILESVQTMAGVRIPREGYLSGVRRLCDEFGALMIIDENETALGRCGSLFAFDVVDKNIVPDVITLGTALSGGLYPLSAAVYRKDYLKFWDDHPFSHLSTFAGSDLACVVGLATLDWIERAKLSEAAAIRGEQFAKGMSRLLKKYPMVIKAVRSIGLLVAVDFASEEIGPQMSRDLSQFGVLAAYSPDAPSTMVVTPSLVVSSEDIDSILDAFQRALAGCQSIMVPMRADSLASLLKC